MKKNYALIDIFKFISALTIVAIHTQPFLNYMDSPFYPIYGFLKCFSVPFFFISSSYLFFSKIEFLDLRSVNSRMYLQKWCSRLVQIYLVYSVLNAILMFGNIKTMTISDWLQFLLLGTKNGYLWFFAALLESVLIIYFIITVIQRIGRGGQGNTIITISLIFSITLVAMVILQFYTNIFRDGVIRTIIDIYYIHFENVRNVVSGLFYCSIGALIVYLNKYYKSFQNKMLLVLSTIGAYIEYLFVIDKDLCKEEYSTLLLSAVYVFLMLECLHFDHEIRYSKYLRKASNVIYFQHRYVLIFWAICYQISGFSVFIGNISRFFLTISVMFILTYVYMCLEKTKCNRLIKYLY